MIDWIENSKCPIAESDGLVLAHHPEWIDELNPEGIRTGRVLEFDTAGNIEKIFVSPQWDEIYDEYCTDLSSLFPTHYATVNKPKN